MTRDKMIKEIAAKLEVGQAWQFGNETETIHSIDGDRINTRWPGEVRADGHKHAADAARYGLQAYWDSFKERISPERRAGQRWRAERGRLIVTGTLAGRLDSDDGWSLVDAERSDGLQFASCFVDSLWSNQGETMTLISEAPAEPPKRAHDFSDPYVRDSSKRIVCVSCGFPPGWSAACDARDWRARYEANINTDGVTNVLDTPSIPERIDRRLSHSLGVEDPCLPEAGR